MKKNIICAALLLAPFLNFSQKNEKVGDIERNDKGVITSARFPASIGKNEVPQSADDFFV